MTTPPTPTTPGPTFAAAFARLAGTPPDADEHARLAVYQAALGDSARRADLVASLAAEPDPALATSVLAALLEVVPAGERAGVVAAAPASGADFVATRARELAVLDAVVAGADGEEVDGTVLAALVEGSDWLQRRASEHARSAAVLATLAERGRTRKVRARASARRRG